MSKKKAMKKVRKELVQIKLRMEEMVRLLDGVLKTANSNNNRVPHARDDD